MEVCVILLGEEQSNSLSEVFMELAGESRYSILMMLEEKSGGQLKWQKN